MVHDEISDISKQAILNAAKFDSQPFAIDQVSALATGSSFNRLSNNTTINCNWDVSGDSNFNNLVTLVWTLNVSGSDTLSNNRTIHGSLNVMEIHYHHQMYLVFHYVIE